MPGLLLLVLMLAEAPKAVVPLSPEDADRVLTGRAPLPDPTELLGLAVRAAGGADALAAVRTLDVEGQGTRGVGTLRLDVKTRLRIVLPDRMRQDTTFPFGEMSAVLGEGAAFAIGKNGTSPLPAGQVRTLEATLHRNPVALLQAASGPAKAAWIGFTAVDSVFVNLVRLETPGEPTTLGIDPRTGQVRLVTFHDAELGGEVKIVYSDFRPVGAIHYPFASAATMDGTPVFATTVTAARVNVALDAALFRSPAAPTAGAK